jgi:hypothetical protein
MHEAQLGPRAPEPAQLWTTRPTHNVPFYSLRGQKHPLLLFFFLVARDRRKHSYRSGVKLRLNQPKNVFPASEDRIFADQEERESVCKISPRSTTLLLATIGLKRTCEWQQSQAVAAENPNEKKGRGMGAQKCPKSNHNITLPHRVQTPKPGVGIPAPWLHAMPTQRKSKQPSFATSTHVTFPLDQLYQRDGHVSKRDFTTVTHATPVRPTLPGRERNRHYYYATNTPYPCQVPTPRERGGGMEFFTSRKKLKKDG